MLKQSDKELSEVVKPVERPGSTLVAGGAPEYVNSADQAQRPRPGPTRSYPRLCVLGTSNGLHERPLHSPGYQEVPQFLTQSGPETNTAQEHHSLDPSLSSCPHGLAEQAYADFQFFGSAPSMNAFALKCDFPKLDESISYIDNTKGHQIRDSLEISGSGLECVCTWPTSNGPPGQWSPNWQQSNIGHTQSTFRHEDASYPYLPHVDTEDLPLLAQPAVDLYAAMQGTQSSLGYSSNSRCDVDVHSASTAMIAEGPADTHNQDMAPCMGDHAQELADLASEVFDVPQIFNHERTTRRKSHLPPKRRALKPEEKVEVAIKRELKSVCMQHRQKKTKCTCFTLETLNDMKLLSSGSPY